jgi:DNA-binding transcriptional LysR family regulator
MHLNHFDLNLLPSLDALLNERSVTRAADRRGVTQPVMSATLRRLREYFDDPLLLRTGRSMTLTPKALAIVEPVRLAVLQLEMTLHAQPPQFEPSRLRRAFRIVVADLLTPLVIPQVLSRIRACAPGVELHVEPVTDTSIGRLDHGDVDACYCPYDISLFGLGALPPDLLATPVRPAPWVCITSTRHYDFTGGLSRERYLELPHVVSRPSLHADNVHAVWKRLLQIDLNIVASTNSMLGLPSIVASSDLAATIPGPLLELIPTGFPLQWHPVPLPLAVPREMLYWHRRYDTEPGHAWLRQMLLDVRTIVDTAAAKAIQRQIGPYGTDVTPSPRHGSACSNQNADGTGSIATRHASVRAPAASLLSYVIPTPNH